MFFFGNYEIANYAKYSTLYSTKGTKEVIEKLEQSLTILFMWTQNNFMEVKTDKVIWNNCKVVKYLFSGKTEIDSMLIEIKFLSENQQELLWVVIESDLSFEDHIESIWKKIKN